MACSATTDYTLYETFDIKLGVDGYLEAQIILWVILFIPALLIAIGISCGFAKISDKLFCIPLIDKKTVKFDEFHLEDTKAFKGILPKLTSAVKAITLSGMSISS